MDHVIRLIVKGEDFASQVSRNVAKRLVRDQKDIHKSAKDTRLEFDLLTNSIVQFGDAVTSKATTKRGLARVLGVGEKEITDEWHDTVIKMRRMLFGDLAGADRKTKADFLGIQEKKVAVLEESLQEVLNLYNKIQAKEAGTKAGSPIDIRARTLTGVPFEDVSAKKIEKTRGSGRKVIVEEIAAQRGLRSEVEKTAAAYERRLETQKVLVKVAKGIEELQRKAAERQLRDNLRLKKSEDDLALRRLAVLHKVREENAEHVENLDRLFAASREAEFRKGLEREKKLRDARFRQIREDDRERKRERLFGTDAAGILGPDGVRRLALPQRATVTREEIESRAKIQHFISDIDKLFSEAVFSNRVRRKEELKAAEAFEAFASGLRRTSEYIEGWGAEVEKSRYALSRLNRSAGSFVRGFFQLDTFLRQQALIRDREDLRVRKLQREKERQVFVQEHDVFITDEETGARRRPVTEIDFEQVAKQHRALRAVNYEIDLLGRQIRVADNDIDSLGNAFFRAGGKIRYFVNQANQLVNARWLFIITLWTTFVTVLIQLGIALVEIGSSAVKAGAALAGAFTAGVLQALSVIVLLRSALGRISEVFGLAEQQDKLRIRSSTDAEAQAKAEKAAQEALADALEEQKDAIKDLTDARKSAARALVDSALQEKDANLSLREAELGVIQAKERLLQLEREQTQDAASLDFLKGQVEEAQRRLALAQQQGQEAEISAASQQLSIAQQNLSAFLDDAEDKATQLKDAQLGAERAALSLQQARITAKRAREDNAETQRKGVEGSDEVVAALDRIKNATEAVTDAQESLADAYDQRTAAQQQLEDQLKDLTTAERGLFNTVVKLKEKFRTTFRPITDIIVRAFDDGLKKASSLLNDQRITGATRGLATQVAASINKISDFAVSKESRDAIVFFTREAARNLPIVTDALLNIAKAFTRIGVAASPLLRDLLIRFEGLTERFERWSKNTKNVENFLSSASKHLDTWIALGKVIVRFLYVVGGGAAPEGKTFLDRIIGDLNSWLDNLEANREILEEFFVEARKNLEDFVSILVQLGKQVFKAFTSPGAESFVKLIAEVLIPALGQAVILLGVLSNILLGISKIPLAKEIIAFGFAWGIFTRVIPVLRNLDALLAKIFTWALKKKYFEAAWSSLTSGAKTFAKDLTGSNGPIVAIGKLNGAFLGARLRMLGFFTALSGAAANPYVLAAVGIAALTASLYDLNRQTGIVEDVFNDFKKTIEFFYNLDKIIIDFGINVTGGVLDAFGVKDFASGIVSFFGDIATASGLTGAAKGAASALSGVFTDELEEKSVADIKGVGLSITAALGSEYTRLGRDVQGIQRNLISSLSALRGDVLSALELPLYEQTPAAKEAERIRKQEAARDRQQQVNDAKSRTKAQQQEFNRASVELRKAQKAVNNASTADEKREAKQRLANAKQNYTQAKKSLEEAVESENEIKHDAAVQARLDYLDELDKQQRQAVEKRVNQAKAEANALFDGLMKAIKDKDWNKAQQYINNIVKLLGKNSIFELGALTADYLVKGIEDGLKKNQKRLNNAAKKSAKQAALAATGEPTAEKLLKSTTADEDIPGTPGGRPLTSAEKLNYLLQSGKIDLKLAGAILKAIDAPQLEKKIIRRMFKLLDIKMKVKDVLGNRNPEDYLLNFLEHHPNQQKALAAFGQAVYGLQIFDVGGQVSGASGQAVPIIAHAGEWVLNKGQQSKLSARMGESTGNIKSFLFGKDSGKPKRHYARGGEITDAHDRMDLKDWVPAKKSWEKGMDQAKEAAKMAAKISWEKGWPIVDKAASLVSKLNILDPVRKLPGVLQSVLGGKNSYDVAKTQITDLLGMVKGARAGNHTDQALLSLMFLPGILRTKKAVTQAIKYGEKMGIIAGSKAHRVTSFKEGALTEERVKKWNQFINDQWDTRAFKLEAGGKNVEKQFRAEHATGFAKLMLKDQFYDRLVAALDENDNPLALAIYRYGEKYDKVPLAAGLPAYGLSVFRKIIQLAKLRNKGLRFSGTDDSSYLYKTLGIRETKFGVNEFEISPREVRRLADNSRALARERRISELKKARTTIAKRREQLASGRSEVNFWGDKPYDIDKWGDALKWLNASLMSRFKMHYRDSLQDDVIWNRLFETLDNPWGALDEPDSMTNKAYFEALLWAAKKANPKFTPQVVRSLLRRGGYKVNFQHGGEIGENRSQGAAVPIIAHVGEWVLNKTQQSKLAKKLAVSVDQLKKFVFGEPHEPLTNQQYESLSAKKVESRRYGTFELARAVDDYKQDVYFIEFDDGAFGQISKRDADRIVKTGGQWVPQWVRRTQGAGHGFTASYLDYGPWFELAGKGKKKKKPGGTQFSLAKGGEILASMAANFNPNIIDAYAQSYAAGGVVTASPDGVSRGGNVTKTVNQNFNVRTEGETDWNYVMRLGGIHAMG